MKKQIILGILSLIASTSMATPLKDAACAKNLRINHPQGSSGLFFDETCKTAYVLPPAMSEVSLTSIVSTTHANQCGFLNSMIEVQEQNAALFEKLIKEKKQDPGSGLGSELDRLLAPKEDEVGASELERRSALIKKFAELVRSTDEILQEYQDSPAASATISFRLPWDRLIKSYQNQNSGVTFVRMPLTQSYLTFNRVISKMGNSPALLDYDIPGVGAKDVTPANANSSSLLAGDAYSGQIILSMVGACPFYRKSTRSLVTNVSGQSLTAYLNANMNFDYQLQVKRHYVVKYNLGLLVKRIHQRSSSGGFFSTSSHVTEINDSKATDWFHLENKSNDARFNYELQVSEVKADMMNRAIRDITMMANYKAEDAPQVIARTKNGAQASAEALQKCPNQYCQIGALGLQALDAIFGSSSATSTYINDRNAEVTDEVDDNKMISFSGASTFAPEGRVY